eukprot:jgi/Chrpa1/12237/Chrysochromulina_OHIO_Genome00004984-RA
MAKRKPNEAAPAQPDVRRSKRDTKAPERFRPSHFADVPHELMTLIHDVAASAASKSDVPFEADAIVALEEALEPMLEALCAKAFVLAAKDGRDTITEDDLRTVSKEFMAKK